MKRDQETDHTSMKKWRLRIFSILTVILIILFPVKPDLTYSAKEILSAGFETYAKLVQPGEEVIMDYRINTEGESIRYDYEFEISDNQDNLSVIISNPSFTLKSGEDTVVHFTVQVPDIIPQNVYRYFIGIDIGFDEYTVNPVFGEGGIPVEPGKSWGDYSASFEIIYSDETPSIEIEEVLQKSHEFHHNNTEDLYNPVAIVIIAIQIIIATILIMMVVQTYRKRNR